MLVDLGLFVQQLGIWQTAKERGQMAERDAGALWAALLAAKDRFHAEVARREEELRQLEIEKKRMESARTTNGRRQNFFRRLKAQLEVGEAEAELKRCEQVRTAAQSDKRLGEMAVVLGELRILSANVTELGHALERERTQAKPVLEALQELGAAYKFQVEHAAGLVATNQITVQQEHKALRDRFKKLGEDRTNLLSEQSTKQQEKNTLDQHFALRETHRDRLRNEGLLETKEVAADALARWRNTSSKAKEAEGSAGRLLVNLRTEQGGLAGEATQLSGDVAAASSRVNQFGRQVSTAEAEEERLATHEQTRAAIEASRADLNLPQTAERLSERAASLLRQILRLNVEGAEDEQAQASVDKQRLDATDHKTRCLW